jgi:hypothetical protein
MIDRVCRRIVWCQAAQPGRLQPLAAKHLFVSAQQARQARHVSRDDGFLGCIPDSRERTGTCSRGDFFRKRGPAVEAVLARDDELRIGQGDRVGWHGSGRALRLAHRFPYSPEGLRIARLAAFQEVFGLFLVLLDVRMGRQIAGWHTNLLSPRLGSARIRLKEGSLSRS